ncbi:isoaspartyl peptidase/L-asparaginase [Lysobacteraceae bacterium NML03-0222]|nr:isoaspartyl peptidase/L-asparaginase [Xanthomonadaceae bacterium NML03-0222]
MRTLLTAALMLALPAAALADEAPKKTATPQLIIHGGAGVAPGDLSAEEEAGARAALQEALLHGQAILKAGKSAQEAVVAAIVVLEDSPYFNAGRGAVFTHEGRNELDASLMVGNGQRAGAVAGVRRVKNPITLAQAVMEHSPHVMLTGQGAETFAEEKGVTLVDPSWFRTEKRWQQLQRRLAEEAGRQAARSDEAEYRRYVGTVGAVAMDAQGNLAAGTSTGGMTNKRWNRVGDSPVIGAGTWADSRCAVSGTGWGEFYIRSAAAHNICARVAHRGEHAAQAGGKVINEEIVALGGDGGALVMTADGGYAFPFNTPGMYRGWVSAEGTPQVAIYASETLQGDVKTAAYKVAGGDAPAH